MTASAASAASDATRRPAGALAGPEAVTATTAFAPVRPRMDFTSLLLLLLPSLIYVLLMFVYPFLYGIYLSLHPKNETGFSLANYLAFFGDAYQFGTIWITFSLAIPCAVIVMALALLMQQFPFCFLMLVGYISGIDPSLEGSARVLGATPWVVFRRVMLPLIAPGMAIAFALVFVMSFAVFPSAIMLGQPAGATRTLAIAAYQQAFEQDDMSYASAIAIVMGLCQMGALLVIMLFRRGLSSAATMGAGKR